MFNEDYKSDFLETLSNKTVKKFLREFFNNVEIQEETLNKDCAFFTDKEVITAIENSLVSNDRNIKNIITGLTQYKAWYNDNIEHCETSNLSYSIVDEIDIKKGIARTYFMSLDDLLNEVDDGRHLEGDTDAVVFIFFWYGLSGNEMVKIKKSDVVFQKGIVKINLADKVIEVNNKRAAEILMDFYFLTSFQKEFSVNNLLYVEVNDVYFLRDYKNPDNIRDDYVAAPMDINTLISRTYKMNKKRHRKITGKYVSLSANLFNTHELVKAGVPPIEAIAKTFGILTERDIKSRYKQYQVYASMKT